jgi:two-component system sensor histidine kinase KdpD
MIDSEDKRPEPESPLAIAKQEETARDIDVFLFTGREQPIPKKKIGMISLLIYVISAIVVIIGSLFGFIFRDILGQVNLLFLMILPVVLIAIFWGRGPSILAAVLSVIIFDFLFVEPYYSFAVSM